MLQEHWNQLGQTTKARRQGMQAELARIEEASEQLLTRITSTQVPTVTAAYEKRIEKLEQERAVVAKRIASCGRPGESFETTLRTAMSFLANPCAVWESEHYEHKRKVLELASTSNSHTREKRDLEPLLCPYHSEC